MCAITTNMYASMSQSKSSLLPVSRATRHSPIRLLETILLDHHSTKTRMCRKVFVKAFPPYHPACLPTAYPTAGNGLVNTETLFIRCVLMLLRKITGSITGPGWLVCLVMSMAMVPGTIPDRGSIIWHIIRTIMVVLQAISFHTSSCWGSERFSGSEGRGGAVRAARMDTVQVGDAALLCQDDMCTE